MSFLRLIFVLLLSAAFSFWDTSAAQSRPIQFADILAQRTFAEVQIRPTGSEVAFVVSRARLEQDDYLLTLYVLNVSSTGESIRLAEGAEITNVRWKPNSGELSFWDGEAVRLILIDTASKAERQFDLSALGERNAPSSFEWNPDGTRLAVLIPYQDPAPSKPYVYQDAHFVHGDSLVRETGHEFAILNADGSIHCRSGTARWPNGHQVAWAPDGGAVAFISYRMDDATGSNATDAILIGANDCLQTKRIEERNYMRFGATNDELISVSKKKEMQPDGKFLFRAPADALLLATGDDEKLLLDTNSTAKGTNEAGEIEAAFIRKGEIVVEVSSRSESALFHVGERVMNRIDASGKRLSGCSLDSSTARAACVVQSPSEPPEIGVLDFADGSVRIVTNFNAHFDRVRLGKVERIGVPDDEGRMVTMYLVYPLNYDKNRRYPAIVTMYGFDNSFISQAQYITNYAPQIWAKQGYVTLLWNYALFKGGAEGDLAAQARDFQLAQFAVTKNAVQLLIDRGLADPMRIGVAGHSMGSHWADYAIAHSNMFSVASSHAPGGYTPINYWRGGAMWRRRLDHVFGGPPAGESLAFWQAMSPAFFPPPCIPQLREVPDSEIIGEFAFRHWPDSGASVEMIVYPSESHVFHRPQSRLYAMELSTDWFDFWLRGVESGLTGDEKQYRRWRNMRLDQC